MLWTSIPHICHFWHHFEPKNFTQKMRKSRLTILRQNSKNHHTTDFDGCGGGGVVVVLPPQPPPPPLYHHQSGGGDKTNVIWGILWHQSLQSPQSVQSPQSLQVLLAHLPLSSIFFFFFQMTKDGTMFDWPGWNNEPETWIKVRIQYIWIKLHWWTMNILWRVDSIFISGTFRSCV